MLIPRSAFHLYTLNESQLWWENYTPVGEQHSSWQEHSWATGGRKWQSFRGRETAPRNLGKFWGSLTQIDKCPQQNRPSLQGLHSNKSHECRSRLQEELLSKIPCCIKDLWVNVPNFTSASNISFLNAKDPQERQTNSTVNGDEKKDSLHDMTSTIHQYILEIPILRPQYHK